MHNCEHFIELMSAQIDGVLTEAEERELLEHVLVCEECKLLQQDLLELCDTMSDMQALPPEHLHAQIMTALSEEKSRNIVPFYKRKNFVRSLATAAAMLALIAVTSTTIGRTLRSHNESTAQMPAGTPMPDGLARDESANGTGAAPAVSSAPEAFQFVQGEGKMTTAERIGEENLLVDAAEEVIPEEPLVQNEPPAQVDAQSWQNEDEIPTQDEPPAEDVNLVDALLFDPPPQEEEPNEDREMLPEEGTDISQEIDEETPLSLAVSYVGEIIYYVSETVPDFLLEYEVPAQLEQGQIYRLEISALEYRALELQFMLGGFTYEAITAGEDYTPEGTHGIIWVRYD